MESDAENGIVRNDVLSQSYAECVERVAQQKNNNVGFTFDLPKEVLEEREKVWDNFFNKYADEASDEVELDMKTMKPVAAGEEEDDGEDDEEDDDEEEYYSKCRAPLRKLPALIQYWIDTGNPPYQLVGDDDISETGSSLSEGEHSRSGHSAVLRESSDKHKSNTSRCSSVDTAAYILSNTNTTKKSETMAILEGAKISDEHFMSKTSPHRETLAKSVETTKSASLTSPNKGQNSPAKITQPDISKAFQISSELEKTTPTNALKIAQAKNSTELASQLINVSLTSQQSVKLSEILPELQEFDEMLKKATAMNPAKTRSPLAYVRKAPKIVKPEIAVTEASQSSQNASMFPSSKSKLLNRRKLYTGRDSPVDLDLNETKDAIPQHSVRCSLHPALETPSTRNNKVARLTTRVRRRKRKRAMQISEMKSHGNTSQESDEPTGPENSKSDVRYTNFFESLGLTPSKTIVSKPRFKKPPVKRSKETERQTLPRQAKNVAPIHDSIESSFKESSLTEDSGFSPVNKDLRENTATEGKDEEKKILGDKILNVRVEKLSDEFLARYNKILNDTESDKFEESELQTYTTSSSISSGKEDRNSKLEKIELLTNITHDSDSSTILICSCNDNVEQCDSDGKSGSKNVMQTKRRILRSRGSKSSTKVANNAAKPEFTDNLAKLPFVQLEKMSIDNVPVNNWKRDIKLHESGGQKDSKIVFKTSLSPLSQQARISLRNEKKIDLFGSNTGDFTTGSRIFEQPDSSENAEISRGKYIKTRARFSLGISIPSDEEEDSFVKLISGIGSLSNSTEVEDAYHEKDTKINGTATTNFNNEVESTQMEKSRKLFAISTSSDEEDVYIRKSKRRTRNSDSRNDENRRETRIMKNNLAIEANKKEEDVERNCPLEEPKCTKGPSENDTEDGGGSEVRNVKTRGTRRQQKTKMNTLSASKVKDKVKVKAKNTFFGPKDEAAMEIEDSEARRSNEIRKSPRKKSSASSIPKNETSEKNLLVKSQNAQTLFANSKEPGLKEAVVLLTEDDRNLGLKKTNLGAVVSLEIPDQTEKLKNQSTPHGRLFEKNSVRKSLRFQTRLDSDSDAEFEGLRFSLNDKYNPRNLAEPANATGIDKSKAVKSFNENDSEFKATDSIRNLPRRNFKSLSEKQPKNGEIEHKKQTTNLFDDEAKRKKKTVDSLKNEGTGIEAFWKNESLFPNELSIKRNDDSNENQIKTRSKMESQLKRKHQNDSKKSNRLRNHSPLANQRNRDTRDSPLPKKKNRRKPRLLGNSKDWESDDETDSNDDIANPSKKLEFLTNGHHSTQLTNNDNISDRESSRNRQSTSLFPISSDETSEDVDLLFNSATKLRGAKNVVLIPKLNFAPLTKHRNFSSIGVSSIRFRTRLRSDTDDDEG